MKTFQFLTFLLLLATFSASSQNNGQLVKGRILDKISKNPLPGVSVLIVNTEPLKGTASDSDGKFRIENVPYGRYDIRYSLMGYSELVVRDVIVSAGKEVQIEVSLEESSISIGEVTVMGQGKNETINEMATLSARSFTMEEVERYAGGRSDPSRLAANFAGISAPDDSRNDIVIRGNSPTGLLWRIEGMNVPNPNHFNTLGTTGGPVSALNTNVLRNSDFFTSAFPAEYGNAVAGVFDIGFRNGNTEKREHTIQLGALTGLEAMTEGPLKKGNGSSYMAAYRYAFTGVAQAIGIPIGTAATPYYQDLSFKVNFAETKAGRFTLFGIGGLSDITFLHDEIDEEDIFADPGRDSYVKSTIAASGLKHFIRMGEKAYLNNLVGVSYTANTFDQDSVDAETSATTRIVEQTSEQTNYVASSILSLIPSTKVFLKAGVQAEVMGVDLGYRDREFTSDWNQIWLTDENTLLTSVFAQVRYTIHPRLKLNAGIRSQQFSLNNSVSFEPRVGVSYAHSKKSTFGFAYGYHSQMQALSVYFYRQRLNDGTYDESNQELDFTNSHHLVFSYDWLPAEYWRVKAETYYQWLSNVPVEQNKSSFSMLNEGADFAPAEVGFLENSGTGTNVGIELTIERFFGKGYYALLTGSLYDSEYKGSDGIERNTAFNGSYVYNVLMGKEWMIGKAKTDKINLDFKLTQSGGRYYTPVDLEASQAAGTEVLESDEYAFSQRYDDYFRLDVKIGYTRNSRKSNLSQSIFFDVQNVTNNQNIFAQRYNPATDQVNTAYQIGLFPNFLYRIQF